MTQRDDASDYVGNILLLQTMRKLKKAEPRVLCVCFVIKLLQDFQSSSTYLKASCVGPTHSRTPMYNDRL